MPTNPVLPDFVLQELYKNVLVETTETKEPQSLSSIENQPDTHATPASYLGDFNQKVVIYTHSENDLHIAEKDLSFLTKILAACQLNLADVAIINLFRFHNNPIQQIRDMGAEKAILFYPDTIAWDLDSATRLYHPMFIHNFQFVLAHELKDIQNQTALKTQLWGSLKILFEL